MSKYKLGEVCEFINGGAWSDKEYVLSGIPVLKVSNCKNSGFTLDEIDYLPEESRDKYSKNELKLGDVIIATVGSHPNLKESAAGRSCVVNGSVEGFFLNQNAVCVRTTNQEIVDQKYLGYLAASFPFQHHIQMRGRGAANQMRIAIGSIKEYEHSFPEIRTQQRIAGIISAYDDFIENNQKQIKLLEEAAQRLYKEWFIDLRFPGHESTPIHDGIPDGWERKAVTDLLEIKYGKDHKALTDGAIPVYGSGGIMRKVEPVLYSGESVLIPRKGSLNNILYVTGDFWTIDTMFYSVPKAPNIAKYMYLFLSRLDMYSFNIGAAVPSMTVKILDGINVLLPSEEILLRFESVISPMFEKKRVLEKQIETSSQARDRLLPKLMSREIEV